LVPRSVFTFPHSHLNTPDDVRFLDSGRTLNANIRS